MAVSGKCYLSLHSHNASANRGACIQNCRKTYRVTDEENGNELTVDGENIFSSKDLCTIGFLDKLMKTGIHILKIEGRGRSADYIHTTVSCYREAVAAVLDGTYSPKKADDWLRRLSAVFNRGFWDGYYLGRKTGEWSKHDGSHATRRKIYVAKAIKYFKRAGVGEFLIESQNLSLNERIMITGPATGFLEYCVKELRVGGTPAVVAKKGDRITIPLSERIRAADKLYKLVDVPSQ